MKIKIKEQQAGQRLDKFLADELSNIPNGAELSRSQIQKIIKQEGITVNTKITLAHYRLKENDIINIKNKSGGTSLVKNLPASRINKKMPRFKVVAETDEYLVINKPTGVTMHSAPHIKEPTLADALVKKYPRLQKIGEDHYRPGIVHRLDKEVSGLVVIARTQDFFDNLKKQFKQRKIDKNYTALVYGKIEKEEDTINFPIKRVSAGHKMGALPLTNKGEPIALGRQAITEFRVIKEYINYALLKINIKTGRTHQIRVHMTAYGHPIVGDNLYSTKKTRELNKKLNLGRIFLFADELSFIDSSGERQKFKISMPAELKKLLKVIK